MGGEPTAVPIVELLFSIVSLLLALLIGALAWQLKRIITRIDALEIAHNDHRLSVTTNHRPWTEVRLEMDRAIAARIDPMQRQLDRIEALASGHPYNPSRGFTGRRPAMPPVDDGN